MVTNLNDTSDKNTITKKANPPKYPDKLDKGKYRYLKKKSCIRETPNLLTDADSSTAAKKLLSIFSSFFLNFFTTPTPLPPPGFS